jgi:hypothetical protein
MQKILLLSVLIALVSCRQNFSSVDPAVENSIANVTCPQSESYLYDVLYKSLVDLNEVPSEKELRDAFERALGASAKWHADESQFLNLVSEFYQILLKVPSASPQDLLQKVTAAEIGDQSNDDSKQVQAQLQQFKIKWKQYTSQLDVECPTNPPAVIPPEPETETPTTPTPTTPTVPPVDSVATKNVLSVSARAVLVTAYQNCAAVRVPALTQSTQDVQGISRVGVHSDGIGAKRQITDLGALLRTDPYLSSVETNSSCQNVRSNPPIYDYGGKPYTTADANSKLDLFKNAGTGTSVLGIDCSAFVFSAIASSGLKLDPDQKMKAIFVHGISSTMYMNPADNGMRCLSKVKMGVSGTLKEGDIVAISGHVFLIDSVGKDPLGISKAQTSAQCADLTASGFDFVIIQSSPSKNGVGINRYRGADYLAEEPTIRKGFEAYAKQACLAKYQKTDVLMKAENFQIIRHSQASNCKDQRIALVGESCAQACSAVASSQLQ